MYKLFIAFVMLVNYATMFMFNVFVPKEAFTAYPVLYVFHVIMLVGNAFTFGYAFNLVSDAWKDRIEDRFDGYKSQIMEVVEQNYVRNGK